MAVITYWYHTHVKFSLLMYEFLMLQQQFHRLHELRVDSLQKRVFRLNPHDDQQFNHLHVFPVYGQGQGPTAEGIHAVDFYVFVTMCPL